MCGIFGYIGPQEAIPLALEGIKKLEYRGYDSAGVGAILKEIDQEGELVCCKTVGKVESLHREVEKKILESERKLLRANLAIAHTRWATHGKPCFVNAHPQLGRNTGIEKDLCAVVHNGIIENYEALRNKLQKRGITFYSETDTEVIAQLIAYLYKGDLLKAVQRALPLLQGSFAIAILHKNHHEEILCAARESPLAIGLGQGEMYVASDAQAFLRYTKKAIYLKSSEIARVRKDSVEVFDTWTGKISKEVEELRDDVEEVSKGCYQHYMLKEIFEQPQTILNAQLSRYSSEYGTATLDNLHFSDEELQQIQRIVIIACGTSYHAGLIASYMMEELARVPVQVEISSEFRYKNPIVQPNTLAIAISQSGETADTLAAMRELKEKGARIVGICNVQGSTLAREVNSCLFLRAGPEIGVASTKAFTSQLVLLALFTLRLARMRGMSQAEGKRFIHALTQLPNQIRQVLDQEDKIAEMAKLYAGYENFFFIGRRFMYPTALEGALKLKEIAYVNANGYPAGEMKHGPIALINESCPTVAYCGDSVTYQKIISNMMEVKARSGRILAVAPEGSKEVLGIADEVFWTPPTLDIFSPFASTVFSQLLSYHIARVRGTEIDQPRNLAKSVTVE